MDIIQTSEMSEFEILWKDINKKNPTNCQRKKSNQCNNDRKLKVYPFDKGSGFAIMKNEQKLIKRIEEQIGRLEINNYVT